MTVAGYCLVMGGFDKQAASFAVSFAMMTEC